MTVAVETGLWQLDPARSTVAIKHRTMWGMVTVKGAFGGVTGEGEVRPDGTARGTITVDAASLDTKNGKRDEHLRGGDFFDAERHPSLVFAVRDAVVRQDDTAEISGQLTVRGISRPQSVTARVTGASADAVTLTAEFTVDRDQFGMGWNQLGMIRGLTTVTATLGFTRTPA
ncbi:YceI family protein [Streptomyces sp. Qhu-G9]|uniref:YceI family protein n=1 Tax=unclassified Streptomyces TaxID=2593676 RepID=UPI001C2EB26F|nr:MULTISPECIES: YceI family protein [Streptomyces]MBV1938225.1 YceI family protein [Streptomyces sp. BV286]WAU79996.1 YceI family protein [Streptomyces aurantiacus]